MSLVLFDLGLGVGMGLGLGFGEAYQPFYGLAPDGFGDCSSYRCSSSLPYLLVFQSFQIVCLELKYPATMMPCT